MKTKWSSALASCTNENIKIVFSTAARGIVETTWNGSVLTLHNVTVGDSGEFECFAFNGVPKERPLTIRRKLYLLVNRKLLELRHFY